MKMSILVGAAVAAVFGVGTANAQAPAEGSAAPAPETAKPAETPAETPPATPAEKPAAETPAETAAEPDASATAAEQSLESDLNLFWGKRRQVRVVQKRLVEKDGRVELTLFGSTIPNDDFIKYYPVGLRVGYHLSEAFAVEGSFAYAFDVNTDLTNFLEDEIGLKRADIQEVMHMYYNLDILWAPIYGKISVLGNKLSHFETYIGLGAGIFHTTEYPAENPAGNDRPKPAGNALLGFRWFINDTFNIRTDYRHFFFQKFGGGVSIPAEFSLGLGVLL